MRVTLYIPHTHLLDGESAFLVLADEAEIIEHLFPRMDSQQVRRFLEWREQPHTYKDETLFNMWSFLVPVDPEKSPQLMSRVFPYSDMNQEKDTYQKIPGNPSEPLWIRGASISYLEELDTILSLITDNDP